MASQVSHNSGRRVYNAQLPDRIVMFSLKDAQGKAKYTVGQLNYLPIGGQAIAMVSRPENCCGV
jgi:hypothetical protein